MSEKPMRIERRKPLTANIGVFGVGHRTYWDQFPGLKPELLGYMAEFERMVQASGVNTVNFGMADDAESAYALSLFLMRVPDAAMRNIELAGIYVEQAVTAEPDNARFISAMAEAAWARGDKEKARTLAEQALKLAPDSYAIRKQAEAYKAE